MNFDINHYKIGNDSINWFVSSHLVSFILKSKLEYPYFATDSTFITFSIIAVLVISNVYNINFHHAIYQHTVLFTLNVLNKSYNQ